MYSLAWLERNLGQSETGLSGSEFAMTLADLLASTRSSDDLQTELFDLLGFDRIELIQDVLEHRRDIVDSYYLNKKAMKSEIANVAASIGALDGGLTSNKMPSYGTQIMVQSEDEKQMRKQVRKEEKRINKLMNKAQDDSDEDDFDPHDMLAKRQVALATAMSKPLIRCVTIQR